MDRRLTAISTLLSGGRPPKLVAGDTEIQNKIQEALDVGVHITACKVCTDQLGVTETLESLVIEVKY